MAAVRDRLLEHHDPPIGHVGRRPSLR
jgi:hypothetical protein